MGNPIVYDERDFRDLAIVDQADDIVSLAALVHSLEHDVSVYRMLADQLMAALRAENTRRRRLHDELERALCDNGRLREELLVRAGADDEAAA